MQFLSGKIDKLTNLVIFYLIYYFIHPNFNLLPKNKQQ